MDDTLAYTYTTQYDLITISERNNPISDISAQIHYDDGYSDTTESVSRVGNGGGTGDN